MTTIQVISVLVPVLPLLGFLINGLAAKRIKGNLGGIIASVTIAFSFLASVYLFSQLPEITGDVFITEWFRVGSWNIDFSFSIDALSLLLMLIITGVGFLIHLYSIGYMKDDANKVRYFAYLNLFVFFMLMLVMGNSLLLMFIGWEGVGLCSYFLIGFWYKKDEYNLAAQKAFVMNRIGDVGFVVGMFFLLYYTGTLEYSGIKAAYAENPFPEMVLTATTLCLFLAATGKSAQIPLFTWLPDAMAGPTPVSALIHAATMVTAGIYMIGRLSFLFIDAALTMEIILWIGVATCLLGAIIGLKQNDIKKVLAYSTVSQLGLMFAALGAGAFTGAFFHLTTHAFFKALLFLGAGSVIHALHGEQDIRKMGGLKGKIRITFITFLVATIAISGIPPFSGFFSKDEILAGVYMHNPAAWILLQIGSLLTVFYMFRLLYLVFWGEFRGSEHTRQHIHEAPAIMSLPLLVLMVLSAVAGFLGLPAITGMQHWLQGYLSGVLAHPHEHLHPDHATEWMLMGIATAGAIVTIIIATYVYRVKKSLPVENDNDIKGINLLIYKKFYVDEIYHLLVTRPLTWSAEKFYLWVERRTVDGLVNGAGNLVVWLGQKIRVVQNGSTGTYIFLMTIGIILVLILQYFLHLR